MKKMATTRSADPKGRVDLLLLGLARVVCHRLEARVALAVGTQVLLWPHVEPLVKAEIKRRKIPARAMQPEEVVALAFGQKPRRVKCTA